MRTTNIEDENARYLIKSVWRDQSGIILRLVEPYHDNCCLDNFQESKYIEVAQRKYEKVAFATFVSSTLSTLCVEVRFSYAWQNRITLVIQTGGLMHAFSEFIKFKGTDVAWNSFSSSRECGDHESFHQRESRENRTLPG